MEPLRRPIVKDLVARAAVLLCMLAFALPASAEEPWSVDARHPVVATRRELSRPAPRLSAPALALDAGIRLYQTRVSPHDGPRCPLYPTCSAYARQALARHGALMGTLLTVDRLVQEADIHALAPRVRIGGIVRGYDPLEASDFWWARRRSGP